MSTQLSLYDFIGDLAVFRNLSPVDPQIPGYEQAWAEMGMAGPDRPRKQDPDYARALAWFLRRARALGGTRVEVTELVYLGDTALADANAFRNVRAAGGWRGWAFIGAEKGESLLVDIRDGVYTANRWAALAEFAGWMQEQGARLDAGTAVILDIDKTALGARGRNDGAIDRARVAAIEATVAETLGPAFDPASFRRAYVELNQARYHPFTADNQDYLAYACLMLGASVSTMEELRADIAAGRLAAAQDLMARVDAQREQLPSQVLRELHDDIYRRVKAGDPTPFKAFRRREYLETTAKMGNLPDNVPLARRLLEEICLTQEVIEVGRWFRSRGCLVMALSDKPDEATMPTSESAALGHLPLHRTATHVVGQSIAHLLPT
jgi:hypothetical protein